MQKKKKNQEYGIYWFFTLILRFIWKKYKENISNVFCEQINSIW